MTKLKDIIDKKDKPKKKLKQNQIFELPNKKKKLYKKQFFLFFELYVMI